ncbi:MAG: YecA family protein [Anaerolineae bacterium]
MPTIGRNDLCTCGSGRKYKNCHLIHDRIAEQRDLGLSLPQARMLTYLFNFARQSRYNQDILEGFNLYWGGAYEPDVTNEVGAENMRRYFEWFVHDYPTRPDQRFIIDLYAEMSDGKLAPEDQEQIDAWRASLLGVYRILGFTPEEQILLYDPLREIEVTVRDSVYARNSEKGDLLVGRLYELDGVKYLSHMTMALPAAYEHELVAFIKNAYRNYGSEQGQESSWDSFMRTHSYLVNAFLLSERASALRPLIGAGTPYADPAQGRDQLVAAMTRLKAERQKEAAEKKEAANGIRTSSGIILPGSAKTEAPRVAKPGEEKPPKPPKILVPGRDI